jgi:hypothetical protein
LATLTVINSTISGNSVTGNSSTNLGGGIYVGGLGLSVGTTIFAGNTAGTGPDVSATLTSLGYNLIGNTSGSRGFGAPGDQLNVDPLLGPLAANGGPTQTMALLPGSPAIDAGNDSVLGFPYYLTTDQRGSGFSRKVGSHVDIGAFEAQQVPTSTTVASTSSSSVYGQSVTFTATTSPPATRGVTPTGTVTFMDGTTILDTETLSGGTASFTIAALAAGSHPITAVYSGDPDHFAGTSAVLTQTVNPAPLTVTANDAARLHGQPNPPFTASYSGFVLGQDPSALSGALNFSTPATVASHVQAGGYPITPSGLTSTNYAITFVNGTLTITPAPLVITADNQSMVYGAPLPALTASYSGFVNGDTPANLTTPVTLSTDATSSSPVGTYAIRAAGATSADYQMTFLDSTLTVNQANTTTTLASSANTSVSNESVTFTATVAAVSPGAGTPTGTVTFMDGTTVLDTETLSGGTASFSTAALAVGSHPITAVYSGDPDFVASTSAALTQQVNDLNPTNLQSVITAAQTSGGTVTLTAPTTNTLTNTLATITNLPANTTGTDTVDLSNNTTYQLQDSSGNTIPIVASAPSGTTLTIRCSSGNATVYDLQAAGGNVDIHGSSDGTITVVGTSPALTVTGGQVTIGSGVTLFTATAAPTILVRGGSLTIRNSTIQESTGSAQAAILIIGGTVNLGSPADPGGNVINVNGTGELVHNTTSSTVPDVGNTLELNGAPLSSSDLSFTALGSSAVSSVYGQSVTLTAAVRAANPGDGMPTGTVDFIDTTTGADLGTAPASSGVAQLTTAALAAGSHAISAHYLGDGHFAFSLDTLTQSITPAPLTVTANTATKVYGQPNPTFSASFRGFVLAQDARVLGGTLTFSTPATPASHVQSGGYPVTPGGFTSTNYAITFVNGTLTITPAPLTIAANNQSKVYSAPLPALTASYSGFVNGDAAASLTTLPALSTTASAASHVAGSPYAITASGASDPDYAINYAAGSLTVTPAPLTITANNQTMVYGGTLPALTASYSGFVNGDTSASLTTPPMLATVPANSSVGTYTISASGAVDSDYSIGYVNGTLTITKAPLTVTDNQTQLYGVAVALSPTYSGFVLGQNFTTAGITGAPTLSTTAIATSLVGSYPITVGVGTLSAANYSFTAVNGTLTVNPQTAVSATYTGLLYVATASSTTSTATVGLSVTVKDISGGAGDIRNATVTFINRADGSTIASNLPVSLVSPTDITTGTASYNWSVNIGTNNSQSFTIGILVGNDYARNSSADDAVVTVSKPQAGSATGGGYLVNQSSAGLVPGDAGANTNFGFDAKYGSKGLQGQSNIIVRYQGHVYQYQTASITSLTFPTSTKADYAGTGTIQDITNSSSPITLYTGAALQVTMTDNGEPGSNDTIGITIWTPGGALWFSSDWNGTATVEQSLGNGHGGGNLQVRPAQELAGAPAAGTAAVAPLTPDEIRPIAVEAIARWAAAGIDPARLSALNHVVFQIQDLAGSDLAWERQGVITLDRTADGYGWFVDPTPGDDSEFAPNVVNSPARGHIDLLSVVAHEMGHLLGFGEDESNGVTAEYLAPGVRHVPVAIHPPLGRAATASDSASMNRTMPGRQAGVNPACLSVVRASDAISQAVVPSRFSGTIDGFMAWDAAVAEWFSGNVRPIPKNKLVKRMNE